MAEDTVGTGESTHGATPAIEAVDVAQALGVKQSRSVSLCQLLVEIGILSQEQLSKAQETAHREGLTLWRVLVRDGLVMSRDLATLTALHLGLAMLDLRNQSMDPDTVALLPEPLARRYTVLPVKRDGDRLTVAMVDPTDLKLLQDLTVRTG